MSAKHQLIRSLVAVCVLAALGTLKIYAGVPIASLPFTIYDDKDSTNNHYIASGWIGHVNGVKMNESCTNNPHGGKTCYRFEYSEPDNWAGVVWQYPVNDWGDLLGGWNLTGAKELVFWARGEKGGETVTFKFGILGADKTYSDSSGGELDNVKLTANWKEYHIDLTGKDMSCIKTGFAWTTIGQGQPVVFYLDDIQYK